MSGSADRGGLAFALLCCVLFLCSLAGCASPGGQSDNRIFAATEEISLSASPSAPVGQTTAPAMTPMWDEPMETARPADDGGRPDYFNLPRGEFDALYFSPVYLSRSGEALLFSKMDLDGDGEDDMLELSTVTNYDMACTVKLSGGVSYSFETYCRNIEKLSLADLTGDGRPELIFMGENGGNGGNGGHNIYILHADGDGNIVELPLPVIDSYTGYSFTFKFLDGYRFAVSGEEPLPGTFELSGEDAAYFTKYFNLFDENGKALPRQEHKYPDEAGETDRPYDYAVNMEPDGALTLSLYSYTWFGSHVCHMGNGISTVKWDGERLVLVSQGFER